MAAGYGLGVMNFSPDLTNTLTAWGHGGDPLGYAAGCFYLPGMGVTIAIMDNTEDGEAMFTANKLIDVIINHN